MQLVIAVSSTICATKQKNLHSLVLSYWLPTVVPTSTYLCEHYVLYTSARVD